MVTIVNPPAAAASTNPIDGLINNPIVIGLIIVVIVGFIIWRLVKFKSGQKPISRMRVEKEKRIDALSQNGPVIVKELMIDNAPIDTVWNKYDTLWHGQKLLGKVVSIGDNIIQVNGHPDRMFEIVYRKPIFAKLKERAPKLPALYGKKDVVMLMEDSVITNPVAKTLIVNAKTKIDALSGFYYDKTQEDAIKNVIKENIFKSDFESTGDVYFAQSQNMATMWPTFAHDQAMEQTKLNIEEEKRKTKVS